MIEFRSVTKTYKLSSVEKVILRNLSMTFPEDTNIAILGHNGAGKSTLMRMIAGAELPDSGRIVKDVKVSWPLGFGGGFNGYMTGLENARFVARMYGEDPKEVVGFVEDFSELGKSMRLPIKTYSSGMKARLAFGISMAIDFKLYLIDEVMAVGDKRFRTKCDEVFGKKLENSNIMMISHSDKAIRQYCSSACVLDEGELHYFEDIEEAIELHDYNQNKE